VLAIVGQNVGAHRYDRAERTAWTAAAYAMAGMEAIGIVLFLAPRPWLLLFTKDESVIAYGVAFLRTLSLTFMFIGVSITLSAAFQGAGKGLPALAITMVRLVVVAVPLAYLLSPTMGTNGVWAAMAASTVAAGVVSAAWFRAGTWKAAPPPPVGGA
jgi:Na+-driven multidrug efflux pump